MGKEVVVLVHGFFKSRSDMRYLERGLQEHGFETCCVDLPTTFARFEGCLKSLEWQLSHFSKQDTLHYVAHSMGGLLVRAYLASCGHSKTGHCVFIATPQQGTALAAVAHKIPLYSSMFKPIQSLLPCTGSESAETHIESPLGLIAGSRSTGVLGHFFLNEPNDGRVEVASAQSKDADEFLVVSFGHKDIHHQTLTLLNVVEFIRTGKFLVES